MPTSSLMQIPKSRSAEEFECVCTDVLIDTYNTRFTRYGRNGQKQNGIDIYAQLENDNYIVAQCKNYYSPNSTYNLIKQIEDDIKETEQFKFNIIKFIAMTSADRDKNVQDAIMNINSTFRIELWFWEDIQEKICDNISLLYKYYPKFSPNLQLTTTTLNDIISNLNILKGISQNFNNDYKGHIVASNEKDDIEVYNKCVTMVNAASQINILKNQWYLQIQKLGALNIIEDVLRSIPTLYDANTDHTGTNMSYTLSNYLKYFYSADNTMKFINNCDEVIKIFEKSKF